MLTQNHCHHRVCRSGLWFIVGPGCHGPLQTDAINGDRKVWIADCVSCEGSHERDVLEEILDERVLQQLL